MNKNLVYILYIVLLSSVVSARLLEIEEIKFYQNDKRVYSGFSGNLNNIYRGDGITIKIGLINNGNVTTKSIVIFSEIKDLDEGDDIEKELPEFDLGGNDDIRKEIELSIPNDAEFNIYDFFVKIRGLVDNDTEELAFFNYTLEVIEKPLDVKEVITSINNSLTEIKTSQREIFYNASRISELESQKGNLEGQITVKDNQINDLNSQLSTKNNEVSTLQNTNNEITNKISSLQNQITNSEANYEFGISNCTSYWSNVVAKEKKSKGWTMFFVIAIITTGVIVFRNKLLPNIRIGKQKPPINTSGAFGLNR